MTGLIKVLWYFSLFAFVGIVFYAYMDLPENMVVAYNSDGFPDRYLPKGTYFYAAMGAVLIFNLILAGIGSMYSFLPPRSVVTPKRSFWLQDQTHLSKLRLIVKRWFYVMAIMVNIWLLCVHVLVWSLNIGGGGSNFVFFEALFYLQVAMFLVAVVALIWRLNTQRINLSDLPD